LNATSKAYSVIAENGSASCIRVWEASAAKNELVCEHSGDLEEGGSCT